VRFGMTLPTMVRGVTRASTLEWCRRIDAGPYESVSAGERITFHNQDQLVTLSAAAAVTSRVRVIATIVILPMHPAPLVAKQAATLDVLSGGRFVLGVGVGGREHDYRCAGSGFDRRLARLDEQVAEVRRLWRGVAPFPDAELIGPPVVQPGGPPVWCSSFGPRSLERSSRWADGYAGFTLAADPGELVAVAAGVRAAWEAAGRDGPPYLMTSFWCSLGPDAVARQRAYVDDYMRIDPGAAALMVDAATIVGTDAVAAAVDAVEAAGFDELMFVPTTDEVAELDRLEEILARR